MRSTRARVASSAIALAIVAGAATFAGEAAAHGGFWRAYEIFFEPGNPRNITLRSDVWALIRTTDEGQSWQWQCAELYGGRSGNAGERRAMVLLPGGSLVVANLFEGLRVEGADTCEKWPRVEALGEEIVQEIVAAPTNPEQLFAVSSLNVDSVVETRFWRSDDAGVTWSRFGGALPPDYLARGFAVAPTNPNRVYTTGKRVGEAGLTFMARSDDAGETWVTFEMPIADLQVTSRFAGVDPVDLDTIYVWADKFEEGGGQVEPDSILRSRDGGETWVLVLDAVGNLPGFAFSPDGSKVAVAGPEDGLLIADASALASQGRDALEQVQPGRFWGVEWTEEGLFAGTNDFLAAGEGEGFSFGVSRDDGQTFEPLFVICEAELIECSGETFGGQVCPGRFSDPHGEGNFKEDFLDSQRCESYFPDRTSVDAGSRVSDAGVDDGDRGVALSPQDESNGGCGCRVTSERRLGWTWIAAGSVFLAWRRRQRG